MGNSFPAGNKPRSEFIANIGFGHVVVHFFLLPLQLSLREISLQGQNKESALLGAEKRENRKLFVKIAKMFMIRMRKQIGWAVYCGNNRFR
jgi:hypothetical protein